MRLDLLAGDGVFSAADAARHRIDGHALARLVRGGAILRLTRGWYAVTPPDELTPERRHRLTAQALGRQYLTRAAVSHHSMLLLRDLPTYAADLTTVHLTSVPISGQEGRVPNVSTRRRGLVVHRPLPGLKVPPGPPGQAGPPAPLVMPLALAIVQNGLLNGPEAALVSADAALNRSLMTADDLAGAIERLRGHPGVAEARGALMHADGRHESPGESRSAYVFRVLGYQLDPQFEVHADGRRYRADFRIRGTRVLVEFDGALKYRDPRALFDEKQREDALRRQGWVIVRVVWADLDRPDRLRRRIAEALALAARQNAR